MVRRSGRTAEKVPRSPIVPPSTTAERRAPGSGVTRSVALSHTSFGASSEKRSLGYFPLSIARVSEKSVLVRFRYGKARLTRR